MNFLPLMSLLRLLPLPIRHANLLFWIDLPSCIFGDLCFRATANLLLIDALNHRECAFRIQGPVFSIYLFLHFQLPNFACLLNLFPADVFA